VSLEAYPLAPVYAVGRFDSHPLWPNSRPQVRHPCPVGRPRRPRSAASKDGNVAATWRSKDRCIKNAIDEAKRGAGPSA
jgi:hypothetical protein